MTTVGLVGQRRERRRLVDRGVESSTPKCWLVGFRYWRTLNTGPETTSAVGLVGQRRKRRRLVAAVRGRNIPLATP